MCNKYIATELMIPNAAADTERTLGAAERYMYIPHVRGLSKSPHRPLTWCILHMQSRPLGSGVHVRSLHCRYTPVLNALLPRRLAYHSHGPRLDVACSRFWRAVESASCSCSCLCLFVCCAADLPPKAVYRWNSGKLACMAMPRRHREVTLFP